MPTGADREPVLGPARRPAPGSRRWLWLPAACALTVGVLALSWNDVLPGGWRLRGRFEDHAQAARREYLARWNERVRRFVRAQPDAPERSIVFLGSSTIERFPLADAFPGKPTLGRGIGNEPAEDLLARLDASLPTADPAGWVLFTGRIDYLRGAAPEEVGRRVGQVVDALRMRLPGRAGVLIGIPPERDLDRDGVERLARTNAALAEVAAGRGIVFVPTARPPLADELGRLVPELSDDPLHLNPEGYGVLARWLIEEGGPVGRELSP